jgi:hypothetical protein
MSDNIPTSPPAGSTAPPVAPSEPSGVAAPAPAVTPPAQPAAISSPAPATGTAAPTAPQQSQADLAFDQLMADPNAHDNPLPVTAPPATAAPPAPAPAAQAPPATPPASEPPAAEQHESPEPSPAEQQEGKVPLKKLLRALDVRREAKSEAEAAKQALAQEKALTDRVLHAFNAAGIDANTLPIFMSNLARHRNDPQAQAQLLASLGVQAPKPQQPAVDLAAVRARLEAYDAEGALALLNASAQPQPTAPTPPVQQAPPAVQPPQAQPPAQPPPQQGQNVLIQTVATMGSVLRATYGDQEAARLADLIDAEAKAQISEMVNLEVDVTPAAAAKVWQKAQGTVLRAEAQKRAAPLSPPPQAPPAPPIRPAQPAPPKPLTADEAFAQLQASGGR